MNLLKKQRDAVGLSIFANEYEFYSPEKGSDRHYRMIINKLEELLIDKRKTKTTNTATLLHQIAEKIHRRSMIILFTDSFQQTDDDKLFTALQHLKHNKHKVVLFHIIDKKTELNFNFDNTPRKFIDLETGEIINIFADNVKGEYQKQTEKYFNKLALTCTQNKIKYVPVAVDEGFEKILTSYLVEKQSFK
jgi:uncharacterized protein (DUF58 family)